MQAERPRTSVVDWLFPAIPLALTTYFASFVASVADGATHSFGWEWVPSLGVNFDFYLDGLSLVFALLISGIGACVFTYAPGYFGDHRDRFRLYGWLLLFMLSMLGLVLSNNLITLFIFWELTSITSYMLIGFKHESATARAAALQALLVTGMGGLALLAGLLILGGTVDSYELTTLLTSGEKIAGSPLLTPMLILIFLGAFTKSAQFPFHFWLPNAMEAPTPVSAYLHSATMVKAGVYLVARLSPAMQEIPAWGTTLMFFGAVTAVVGGGLALLQSDLKRVLAYSTVAALGTLMLLLGFGTPLAAKATVVVLVCHSLYKGGLFLIAGAIDHCAGTRDVRKLGGLAPLLPWLTFAGILAGASMAGVPPLGGFLAKEIAYEASLELTGLGRIVLCLVFLTSVAFVAVAGCVVVRPFFGRSNRVESLVHPSNWRLGFPTVILGVLSLSVGCFPDSFGSYFVNPVLQSIDASAKPVHLKLWHGFTLPLGLSVLTLLGGVAVYVNQFRLLKLADRFRWLDAWGPAATYEFLLEGMKKTAAWQTHLLQNGKLRVYLTVVLISFASLVGYEVFDQIQIPEGSKWIDIRLYELFIPVLIISSSVMIVRTSSRLAAVCALGVIGYAVAMLFVMYGAPDLAMTQLAIETLTVILFVFVIYQLPRFKTISSRASRLRDAALAGIVGIVMTVVVLAATSAHVPSRVTPFFVENSLTQAKGRNFVNVTLVDFRGLDTLGEIVVLAVAALGIYSLVQLVVEPSSSATRPELSGTRIFPALQSSKRDLPNEPREGGES